MRAVAPVLLAAALALPVGCASSASPCIRRGPEVCNGHDDDCNGLTDDGIVPGPEVCNGHDDDCNGLTDDGVEIGPEVCNGHDDDCNGTIDEGVYGVVGGPWHIANTPQNGIFGAAWASGALRPDGVMVLTWGGRGDDWRARYVLFDDAGTVLRREELPFDAHGSVVLTHDGQMLLFVTRGNRDGWPVAPVDLLMYQMDDGGSLGDPVRVWTSLSANVAVPEMIVDHGDYAIVAMVTYLFPDEWKLLDLLAIDAAGRVVQQTQSLSPAPWEQVVAFATPDGWRAVYPIRDGPHVVRFPGPPADPFGGPERPLVWGTVVCYPLTWGRGFIAGSGDRIFGLSPCMPPGSTADGGFTMYQQFERRDSVMRLVDWAWRLSPGLPASVAAALPDTVVFLGAWSGGPDVQELSHAYWHVRDLRRRFAASAPTGTIEGLPNGVSWYALELDAAGPGRTALLAQEYCHRRCEERLYVVVLGCLP